MRQPDRPDRIANEGKLRGRGGGEPAGGAVILVVHRSGVMMVVGVGTGLVGRVGEGPTARFFHGALRALPCRAVQMATVQQVKLVKYWRHQPGEVEHQKETRPVSDASRPAGL